MHWEAVTIKADSQSFMLLHSLAVTEIGACYHLLVLHDEAKLLSTAGGVTC